MISLLYHSHRWKACGLKSSPGVLLLSLGTWEWPKLRLTMICKRAITEPRWSEVLKEKKNTGKRCESIIIRVEPRLEFIIPKILHLSFIPKITLSIIRNPLNYLSSFPLSLRPLIGREKRSRCDWRHSRDPWYLAGNTHSYSRAAKTRKGLGRTKREIQQTWRAIIERVQIFWWRELLALVNLC